jgi:hypothetical protein
MIWTGGLIDYFERARDRYQMAEAHRGSVSGSELSPARQGAPDYVAAWGAACRDRS